MGRRWSEKDIEMFERAKAYLHECLDGGISDICEQFNQQQIESGSGIEVSIWPSADHISAQLMARKSAPSDQRKSVRISSRGECGIITDPDLIVLGEMTGRIASQYEHLKVTMDRYPDEADGGRSYVSYTIRPDFERFRNQGDSSELSNIS